MSFDQNKSRRKFLEVGIKSALAVPLFSAAIYSCKPKEEKKEVEITEQKKLKILILGGTSFLGPHQIAYALGRGHSVATFTRGKTKPTIHADLFDNVEQLIGDRNNNLTALENRKWDVVIDNSGHRVEWTQKTAELLKDNCKLYLYTSSTGVYYPYLKADYKEDAKVLLAVPEVTDEEEKMEYDYGVMKSNSENEALKYFGADRTIIVRPTYMFGPADKSNRFIYWPVRLSKGGETMVPGKAQDPVQYIDVRDVSEWMIRLIEDKNTGTFNAVGPKKTDTVYSFVEEASKAFDRDTTYIKIDDYEFLKNQNVHNIIPWIMPIGKNKYSAVVNNEKAYQNGLTIRPLQQSIKDTHQWWYSNAVSKEQRDAFELNPNAIHNREKTIIKEWKALKKV